MLAIKDIGDWIEGIIVLVIIAGSALSGIVKAIIAKINRSREEADAQRDLQERPPPRAMDRPTLPVARPMPPQLRPQTITQRRAQSRPLATQRPHAEVPKAIPPMVQTILDVVLDGAVDVEEVLRRPQPSRPQPSSAPRPARTSVPKTARQVPQRATGRRSIDDREVRKAKLVEKRLGHVETHVASSTQPSSADAESDVFERPTRRDLRRAIILNEILSPPLSIRRPD